MSVLSPLDTFSLFKAAIFRLFHDEALPLAGNIAYRLLFAIFPFLIFLTTIGGLFDSPDLAKKIIDVLLATAPSYLVTPIAGELHSVLSVPQRGLFTASVFITLWSAMGGVDSIRVCLNRAYDLKETRSAFHTYALSCFMVIASTIALLLIALLALFSPVALKALQKIWPEAMLIMQSINSVRAPLSLILLFGILCVFHRYLPAGRRRFQDIWPGITFTLFSWITMTNIYGYYLQFFPAFTRLYAGLGGIAAALFFLYLAAILLILGGELNRALLLKREGQSLIEIALQRSSSLSP